MSDFAQVTVSQFVSLSPVSGSVLTAQSLEPASDSVSPSLSVLPLLTLCLSLFLKIKETLKKIFKKDKIFLLSVEFGVYRVLFFSFLIFLNVYLF